MRHLSASIAAILLVVLLGVSAMAFDGNRKGMVLGGGFGIVPAGPHYVHESATKYAQGMSFRFMLGYGWNARSTLTFSRTSMGTIQHYTFNGKDQLDWDLVNVGWELAYTRYRLESHRSTFWRSGLALVDWGDWGSWRESILTSDHQWNLALLAGAGYEIWRGCQVQLDFMAGPGPSDADKSVKALVRLEIVGILY